MITKNSVTINFDGQTHTVASSSPAYAKIVTAIRERRYEDAKALVSTSKFVEKASNGAIKVDSGSILVDGQEVHGQLGAKIKEFMDEGLPFEPLVSFCRKVRNNPSFRAVTQLFSFLEKNKHPITESGNFIAYKKVRAANSEGKMLDIHSGTFDNSPGKTLEMPRNQVNEDPNQTCSHGLHVANWDYAANHFGGPADVLVEVEVDPADVVAIPVDYNESKMRVCRYVVRSIVTNPNQNTSLVRETSDFNDEVEETDEDSEVDCETCEDTQAIDCKTCEGSGVDPCYAEEGDECPDCTGSGEQECDECTVVLREDSTSEDGEESEESADEAEVQDWEPFHEEASLKKMSTDRLQSYKKRVTALQTASTEHANARAEILKTIRSILTARR